MSRKHTITTEEEYNIAVKRVVDLARDLPCLADAPGIDPFEPSVLDDWVAELAGEGVWH